MEACVGINRTDDFLYESMTEPIGIKRMIYCIHMIFRNIQQSVSVCETSCGFTFYCEDIEHA